MPKSSLLLLAGLFPLLWGCSSAPVHYHTLVPAQPGSPASAQVRVERVILPPQVDRSQMVIRQGGSGLVILETEWWGANLVDEFGNALQDLLGAPGPGASLLRVEVQRFDSVPGQYSLLVAQWRLQKRGSDKSLTCRSSQQTRADNSVDSLVTAHQSNLRKLAEQVARANTGGASACP
ncbi:membrane integrity-associated transporter subunit PqiC [Pseudomonas sp. PDM23]|uniref:PqiC family protein n=1 Tax=unclassified Pseudomonas TaxID=196821 RepID=UPI00177F06BA|nr:MULTISPECIES: PqiC family protein [unclassified Pseudomonas]MBD9499492.1 membrane integrity-associated transporter subunit PqiC [Pseudomonas sp. PDM17]MBD9575775.1 membrane integrity-associated transporter subunit PqiC [Pseudomonas sp. PDM23]MBD9669280.1 membrane integrity-associated transporter subunit PqiC [Pseudomonas sp. PDM21]